MRKISLLIPLVLLAFGCMSPEQRLVGKWQGKVQTNALVKSAAGPMGGLMDLFEPQLDLRPDKTFALSLGPAPIEGTWKLENKKLILSPTKMMGMSADEVRARASKEFEKAKGESPIPIPFSVGQMPGMSDMKAIVDEENQKLTLDPGAGTVVAGFGKIVFKKA